MSASEDAGPPLSLLNGRTSRSLLLLLLLPLLAGCHADVNVRFNLRDDGTTFVRTSEIIDDELYKLVLSEAASGDPFYTERMRRDGWLIVTGVDAGRNHLITMSKVIDRNHFNDLGRVSPIVRGAAQSLGTIQFSRAPGLIFERDSLSATIAPLLPTLSSTYSRFFAGIASQILTAALAVHLEVKTPGKVFATNGEIMPDGAVRWTLNLEEPTTVEYSARMINLYHVGLATLIALLVCLALSAVRRVARTSRAFPIYRR